MAKKIKKNLETITKTKLTKNYWLGAYHELLSLGYLSGVMTSVKGAVATYNVLKPLPTKEALEVAVKPLYTKPFTDWYEEAKSDIESLTEEIESWRDNMGGTGLENTSKFEEVSNCADQISAAKDGLPEDVPEAMQGEKVYVHPGVLRVSASYRRTKKFRGGPGRQTRLDEATGIIEALMDATRAKREGLKQTDKNIGLAAELEEFEVELQNALDEAGSVDFPGMF